MSFKIDTRVIEQELKQAVRKVVVSKMSSDEIIAEIRGCPKALKLIRILDKRSTKKLQGSFRYMDHGELQPYIQKWDQLDYDNGLTVLQKYGLIEISSSSIMLTNDGDVIAVKLRLSWSNLPKRAKCVIYTLLALLAATIYHLGAISEIMTWVGIKPTDVVTIISLFLKKM